MLPKHSFTLPYSMHKTKYIFIWLRAVFLWLLSYLSDNLSVIWKSFLLCISSCSVPSVTHSLISSLTTLYTGEGLSVFRTRRGQLTLTYYALVGPHLTLWEGPQDRYETQLPRHLGHRSVPMWLWIHLGSFYKTGTMILLIPWGCLVIV